MWGRWLSKKPFQNELAMHRLTFDPRQRRVLLLVSNKGKLVVTTGSIFTLQYIYGPEGVHHSRRKSQITFD